VPPSIGARMQKARKNTSPVRAASHGRLGRNFASRAKFGRGTLLSRPNVRSRVPRRTRFDHVIGAAYVGLRHVFDDDHVLPLARSLSKVPAAAMFVARDAAVMVSARRAVAHALANIEPS